MISFLKFLLSATTLVTCGYGINIFGFSLWPILFAALSVFLLISIYVTKFNIAAIVVARIMGSLSLLAFLLLLLASTAGGSTHMSESNEIVAFALALMALFGCSFFLIKIPHADK